MKVSENKHSRWVYAVLILMLVGLLSFSLFPLINFVFHSPATSQSLPSNTSAELESQATGYQLVLEREPDNETALKGLLSIRLQQGDLEGALQPLDKLASLNPDLPEYTILLAQTKQRLEDYSGAEKAYQSILSQEPAYLPALQGLVNLWLFQEQTDQAIQWLRQTLQNNSLTGDNLLGVQLLLGQVYALSDRYSEAIAIYDQIISANPEDFRPVLAKAIVLQSQKDPQATELFAQATTLAPAEYQGQIQALQLTPEPEVE